MDGNQLVTIQLYVVTTKITKDMTYLTFEEKEALEQLEELKTEVCLKFGGFTIIPNCVGYWVNAQHKIEKDIVEIWQIVNHGIFTEAQIRSISEKLKRICAQKEQLFTINGNPYLI